MMEKTIRPTKDSYPGVVYDHKAIAIFFAGAVQADGKGTACCPECGKYMKKQVRYFHRKGSPEINGVFTVA
jgi:hypothetical protein